MKIAFYNAFQPNAEPLDKIIAVASGGTKSHVEGVFGDGEWFSISPRDKDGARFKTIEPKDGSWTFINVPISKEAEIRIRDKCLKKIGTKYAYVGAIFSITYFCFVSENKDFCSRLWANLLSSEGIELNEGCTYSPEELYDALIELNFLEIKE